MKKLLISAGFVLLFFSSAAAQLITIDAEKDAFYNGLTNPDDGKIFMPARCYLPDTTPGGPLGGPENGDADISGIIWTCWEDPYIYYYAEVTDDTVCVTTESPGGDWSNDKIELKYDPDPNLPDVGGGVIQVGLSALDSADAQNPLAVDNLHEDGELQLPNGTKYVPTPADYARRRTVNGYVLEWRINLGYINKGGRNLPPPPAEVGLSFGTTININDNDSASRRDMLQWSAGHQDAAWSFPRLQGTITLLADNKVMYEGVSPNDPTIFNDSAEVWYFTPLTSVDNKHVTNIPASFTLLQNYPNPFNPSTTICYDLDKPDKISLTIYNITGEVVRSLLTNQAQNSGTHEVNWNAHNNKGLKVNSGVYFYQIKSSSAIITKKMVLMQ